MTNNIAKIRAALEFAKQCELGLHIKCNEALAALAELEKAAAPLVEIREPKPEECERISMAYYDDEALVDRDHYHLGKDMFDAVRAVMWPKEGL